MSNTVKIAAVQAGSILMDKEASLEKAKHYILKAAKQGANIIVFPEVFLSGYPRGMDFCMKIGSRDPQGRKDFLRYSKSAITVPSEETDLIGSWAKQANAYVVMGVLEKEPHTSGGTVYCSVLFFDPQGQLIGKHRKLKPTGSERLIWGEGDGSTLPVFDTPYGRIGTLICWENYMPLARAAMYAQGVQIYLAPTADARDSWQASMKHIAMEGRCFVVSVNQYVTKEMYPKDIVKRGDLDDFSGEEMTRGASCIIDPLGEYVVKPVVGKEELLFAEIDLDEITAAQVDFDPIGHYARPDVFQLLVNRTKQENALWLEQEEFEEEDKEE